MVNIQLLCVGKLKEKHFSAACAEYQKRLGAFCKLTVTELPEVRLPEHPTPTQVEGALAREGEALLAKLPKSTKVIALCVEGVQLSSPPWPPSWSSGWWKGPPISPSSLAGPSACTPQ